LAHGARQTGSSFVMVFPLMLRWNDAGASHRRHQGA
jgi:hypothetical protein